MRFGRAQTSCSAVEQSNLPILLEVVLDRVSRRAAVTPAGQARHPRHLTDDKTSGLALVLPALALPPSPSGLSAVPSITDSARDLSASISPSFLAASSSPRLPGPRLGRELLRLSIDTLWPDEKERLGDLGCARLDLSGFRNELGHRLLATVLLVRQP